MYFPGDELQETGTRTAEKMTGSDPVRPAQTGRAALRNALKRYSKLVAKRQGGSLVEKYFERIL